MKKKKILVFILVLGVIGFCIWFYRLDRFGFSSMKWVDTISYKGENYDVAYSDNDSYIKVKELVIDKNLGKTKFKLSGNVRNPYYIMRNMDATILDKGTLLYSLKNVNVKEMIAAKVDGNYYLYINNKVNDKKKNN
jgi:hypothetical protein